MELEKLLKDLAEAHSHLDTFKQEESRVIEFEAKFLMEFAKKVFPFSTKKKINGEDALLIYVFSNDKTIISSEVFFTKSGVVTYQVYDEKAYIGFRKDANIEGGYVKIPVKEFLQYVSFPEIVAFFTERVDIIYQDAEYKSKQNKDREAFLRQMKPLLYPEK